MILFFIARNPLQSKSYFEVERAMRSLIKKAGLYNNEEITNTPN